MSNERFGFQSAQQRQAKLDADAMCTQCGTVNPEGTLICRTCGNNLRDQRALRAEADRILGGESRARSWLNRNAMLAGLVVTGVVLLVVALNAGPLIESIMSSSTSARVALWRGEDAGVFAGMLREIDTAALTDAQMTSVIEQGVTSFTEEGMFVLAMDSGAGGLSPIGTALVRQGVDRQRYLFVARVGTDSEVRGIAQMRGPNLYTEIGASAVLYQGSYYDVTGTATRDVAGRFLCRGNSSVQEGEETRQLYAYPVK